MALFHSFFTYPIPSVQSHRHFAIPKRLVSETLISKSKPISMISEKSNPLLGKSHCCLSLSSSSSVEDDDKSPPTRIFIKGLPESTAERSLKTAFSQFGEVSRVKIITDKKTRQSLGLAYVSFAEEESAQIAVKEMNGKFFEGRFVFVTNARPGAAKNRAKPISYKF